MPKKRSKPTDGPPGQGGGLTRPFGLAVLAAAGLFAVVVWARHAEPLGLDQGLFAVFGQLLLDGGVPYRDVWDHKPPGLPVFFTAAFGLFGERTGSIWLLEGLWLAASAVFAGRLSWRLHGRWAGLAAGITLIVVIWAPMWGGYWARAQAEELVALPLLGAAWATWSAAQRLEAGRRAWGPALVAGVLTGLAGLFKLPAVGLVAAWPWLWFAGFGLRRALRPLAALVIGAGLPWIGLFAVFAALGAFRELWEAIFVYPTHYAEAVRAAQPWGRTVWMMANAAVRAIPFALLGGALGIGWLAWRRDRSLLLIGPWALLSIGLVLAQGQGAGYHFQIVAPPLALATGLAVVELSRGLRGSPTRWGRIAAGLALLGLLLLAVREASSWVESYGPGIAHRLGTIDRSTYLGELDYGGYEPRVIERTAAGIARSTAPGDSLLVWGLAPTLYFLSDREPVTRFPFHHLLLTEEPLSRALPGLEHRRAQFLERLLTDPPEMILVGRRDVSPFEKRDSYAQMVRFERFHDFVRGGYQVAGESARFLVFRRSQER